MKKNATTKTKKDTKNTGKVPSKKAVVSKPKNQNKGTKVKLAKTTTSKRTDTKSQNTSKTAKNTPKKARERVTASNYQRLAMGTCLPQCKCWEYAIHELLSEWHEALAKIEGGRAKLVRLDGKSNGKDWFSKRKQDIKEELGDIFWSLALICELQNQSFEKIFKATPMSSSGGFSLSFAFYEDDYFNYASDKFVSKHIKLLKRLCYCMRIKASDCLEANIRKLAKRQAEGKIQGDGDER